MIRSGKDDTLIIKQIQSAAVSIAMAAAPAAATRGNSHRCMAMLCYAFTATLTFAA